MSCRFEEMRTFRKFITEFVLDPGKEPTGFPSLVCGLILRSNSNAAGPVLPSPGRARDPPADGKVDADRSHLLALWLGPTAAKWGWAVRQLCEGIVLHARLRFGCEHRGPEYVEMLQAKLNPLSQLTLTLISECL